MAHSGLCCGLYRGTLYLKDLANPNAALLPIGNAEMNVTQEMTEITQPNYQSLGGSNCSVSFPNSVNLEVTMHCISPENLAIAFLGEAGKLVGATVTDEEHVVNAVHELVDFLHVPDKTLPIIVTSADGVTTYVSGTDYVVKNSGIEILENTTIAMGSTIKVDYTYGDNFTLDAQTMGQKEFYAVLDGANYGEGGARPAVLKAWKVKFSPTDSFGLISGEDFASLAVTGEILKDDSKPTGSKFFKVEWAEKAEGAY